jgi:hypothetical protein
MMIPSTNTKNELNSLSLIDIIQNAPVSTIDSFLTSKNLHQDRNVIDGVLGT